MAYAQEPSLQEVLAQLEKLKGTVKHLIEQQASPTEKLFLAIKRGDELAIKDALRNDASLTEKNDKGETPLIAAVNTGSLYLVEALINGAGLGEYINALNDKGQSALHVAMEKGSFHFTSRLINVGVSVNLRDASGNTAVMEACRYRYSGPPAMTLHSAEDAILELARGGADMRATNQLGKDAKAIANDAGNGYLSKALAKAADVSASRGWEKRQPKDPDNHTFTIPNGSVADAFNSAVPAPARAMQNYMTLNDPPKKDLVAAETVLAALAMETVSGANRQTIYPVEMESFLPTFPDIDQHREVFNILKGQSKYGMGFVALRVLGDDKKPAHLLVIEDQMRQKMFVVGNASVDPALKEKLAENGVSYSNQGDRDMPSAVNKFFSDCFAFRVSSRVIAAGHERYLEGQMIGAISGVVELPQDLDPASIGNVLAIAKVDPTIYTNIVKEPKPKSKPAAAKR